MFLPFEAHTPVVSRFLLDYPLQCRMTTCQARMDIHDSNDSISPPLVFVGRYKVPQLDVIARRGGREEMTMYAMSCRYLDAAVGFLGAMA